MTEQNFEEYCQAFKGAETIWPALPLPLDRRESWWDQWMDQTPVEQRWLKLHDHLPQLWIQPGRDTRRSERYRRLVLQGKPPNPADRDCAPSLADPNGVKMFLARQPWGAVPVLSFDNHEDFKLALRCLAFRCEDVNLPTTVHSQAISGLPHWGLIREIDSKCRCQMLLLHRAPYSSIPAELVPGQPEAATWIAQSQQWRLAHELTHLACLRLVGEMRINLFDELLADAIGMLAGLGLFSSELFRQGLGLNKDATLMDNARAKVYVSTLKPEHHRQACLAVLERAKELERLLNDGCLPHDPMPLLQCLVRQRLNQSITVSGA